jgi:hypothetical protein
MNTFKSIILPAIFALAIFNIALLVGVYGLGVQEYAGQIGVCAGICVTTFLLAVDPFEGHID